MATLRSYFDRMPAIYRHRYVDGADSYWVVWANGLLDRLSGAGLLPPQSRSVEADVVDGVWVEFPSGVRDVREIRDAKTPSVEYRFIVQDGKLRIIDTALPPDTVVNVVYVAAFASVSGMDDELNLGMTYENLVDTWFRWKVEEQVAALSEESKYWRSRFEEELARIRAEASNRMNRPKGRYLAGFR